MYVVIANVTAGPDHREELSQVLAESAAASRSEDGCISYVFTSDVENPSSFSSIEVWQDKDALMAHLAGPGVAKLLERVGPLIAGAPTITGYDVPGDPDKLA